MRADAPRGDAPRTAARVCLSQAQGSLGNRSSTKGGVEERQAIVAPVDERVVPTLRIHGEAGLHRQPPVVADDEVVHLVETPRLRDRAPSCRNAVGIGRLGEPVVLLREHRLMRFREAHPVKQPRSGSGGGPRPTEQASDESPSRLWRLVGNRTRVGRLRCGFDARRERHRDAALAKPVEVAAERSGHLVLVTLLLHPPGRFGAGSASPPSTRPGPSQRHAAIVAAPASSVGRIVKAR